MKLIVHFVESFIAAAVVYFYAGFLNAFLVFIGGFFVDVDHLLWWLWARRNFDYKAMLEYFDKQVRLLKAGKTIHKHLLLFHTAEFLLVMLAVSELTHNYFLLLGLVFHFAIDACDQIFMLHGRSGRRLFLLLRR